MTALANGLLDPLRPPTQRAICDTFWNTTFRKHALDNYWNFYTSQCDHALRDDGTYLQARYHDDVLEIARLLKAGQERSQIHNVLRPKFTKQHNDELELMDRSIDLAANLLLMIEFGDNPYSFDGRRRLPWETGSLEDNLKIHFRDQPSLGHEGVKLHKVFQAVNLERIAGIRVIFTNNLLDHLRLTNDDTTLHVFHQVSFLQVQAQNTILPAGLVEETVRTLKLLFPSDDAATKKHYQAKAATLSFDPQLIRTGHLKTDDRQIEKFVYWHDQLIVLKQVFDEATPQTIAQWWYDRRNGVQWYTFWVAIIVLTLTLFFGLVQSIEGALQVYGTFRGGKSP